MMMFAIPIRISLARHLGTLLATAALIGFVCFGFAATASAQPGDRGTLIVFADEQGAASTNAASLLPAPVLQRDDYPNIGTASTSAPKNRCICAMTQTMLRLLTPIFG